MKKQNFWETSHIVLPGQLKLIGFKKVPFEMTLNVSYSIGPLTLVENISTWISHIYANHN